MLHLELLLLLEQKEMLLHLQRRLDSCRELLDHLHFLFLLFLLVQLHSHLEQQLIQ